MTLELLNGIYKIPIKVMGSSNSMGQKAIGQRGPQAKPDDFQPRKNFIDEQQADFPAAKSLGRTGGRTGTGAAGPGELPKWI